MLARPEEAPAMPPALQAAMLAARLKLRAFAISLSGNADRADDLVQETMLRALANAHQFEPGTNLEGWLFTILRNTFYTEHRKRSREAIYEDIYADDARSSAGGEHDEICKLDCARTLRAAGRLPELQRKVLELVVIAGLRYEDAALALAIPLGTVRSALWRARDNIAFAMGEREVREARRASMQQRERSWERVRSSTGKLYYRRRGPAPLCVARLRELRAWRSRAQHASSTGPEQ